MGLLQHPGRVVDGEIFFQDQDILSYGKRRMRRVRGKEIAMIFQDPMTSLNPVYHVWATRSWRCSRSHEDIGKGEAKQRAHGDAAYWWAFPIPREANSATTPTSSPAACASGS